MDPALLHPNQWRNPHAFYRWVLLENAGISICHGPVPPHMANQVGHIEGWTLNPDREAHLSYVAKKLRTDFTRCLTESRDADDHLEPIYWALGAIADTSRLCSTRKTGIPIPPVHVSSSLLTLC